MPTENTSRISEQTAQGLNRLIPISWPDFLKHVLQPTKRTVKSRPVPVKQQATVTQHHDETNCREVCYAFLVSLYSYMGLAS